MVPLAYRWSFRFQEHSKAMVTMIVFNIVTGAALGIVSYVLIGMMDRLLDR